MIGNILVFISMVFIGYWIGLQLLTRNKIKSMDEYINGLIVHLNIEDEDKEVFKQQVESWTVNYGSVDYLAKKVKEFTQLEELDNIVYQILLKIVNKWKY